jgi:DNA-binding NtrC family response regulator
MMNAIESDILQSERSVLIVEDALEDTNRLIEHLENAQFKVAVSLSGENALQIIEDFLPDIILIEIQLPGMDGFETCRRLKQYPTFQKIPIIFMTLLAQTEHKLKGFMVGGVDYITKPYESEEVIARLSIHLRLGHERQQLAQKNAQLVQLNKQLRQQQTKHHETVASTSSTNQLSVLSPEETKAWGLSAFIGQSNAIKQVINDIHRLQKVESTNVLILGETGTGKELIARAIHFGGIWSKGPFVPVNCSAIPESLAESSFFGHVKGAFTGAIHTRKGFFEQAQGGTLFLDEIGDMPLSMQAKLLRIIEDSLITPVGSHQNIAVKVHVITATSANLVAKMANGQFRQDLYFRLAGYTINVPPLRERKDDILLLTTHFMSLFAHEIAQKPTTLNRHAESILKNYHFPGNIRELKNVIDYALLQSDNNPIQAHHLNFFKLNNESNTYQRSAPANLEKLNDEDKVIAYIHQHGYINNTQCRQLFGYNLHQASYLLKKMYRKGLLARKGKARWVVYSCP